ncbi:MAG: FMN-binding protein [Spirochaetaceae bacterium]|nr:MAG: FMN-binding protein [Spirochaetaceae bacterium]
MKETLNRLGKVTLVLMAGLSAILAIHVVTGGARDRALNRIEQAGLLSLAGGETITDSGFTAQGRAMWTLPDSGGHIVRERLRGYQSHLEVLIRMDPGGEMKGFAVLSAGEGPHVLHQLKRGDPDALSGATVTEEAIRAAVARIRRDVTRTLEEGS